MDITISIWETIFKLKLSYCRIIFLRTVVDTSAGRGTRVLGYPRVHVTLAGPGLPQRTPLGLATGLPRALKQPKAIRLTHEMALSSQ